QLLSCCSVHDPYLFVPTVADMHERLGRIRGKAHPTWSTAPFQGGSLAFDKDVVSPEVTHFVEDLDATARPITHVDKTVSTDNYAMYSTQKHATYTSVDLCQCALSPPLAGVGPLPL